MDIERFLENINFSKEYLNIVLRSHLFIEAKIIEMIKDKLVNPGAIELSSISFPLKLQLCVALGVLDTKDLSPLKKLNKLRNEAAHKLEFEISDKDIEDFISTFNNNQLRIANFDKDDCLVFRFRKSLMALYMIIGDKKGDIELIKR